MNELQEMLDFYKHKLDDKQEQLHSQLKYVNITRGEIRAIEGFVEDLENMIELLKEGD